MGLKKKKKLIIHKVNFKRVTGMGEGKGCCLSNI